MGRTAAHIRVIDDGKQWRVLLQRGPRDVMVREFGKGNGEGYLYRRMIDMVKNLERITGLETRWFKQTTKEVTTCRKIPAPTE